MSTQEVIKLAKAIKNDSEFKALCASTKCADVDDQCAIAKQRGFDVHPHDFDSYNNGILVESSDEDSFLKPNWWNLVQPIIPKSQLLTNKLKN